jgi:hypothetical protein
LVALALRRSEGFFSRAASQCDQTLLRIIANIGFEALMFWFFWIKPKEQSAVRAKGKINPKIALIISLSYNLKTKKLPY